MQLSEDTSVIRQELSVTWEFPVAFTHHVFSPQNLLLVETLERLGESRQHLALVIADSHVLEVRPHLQEEIAAYFRHFADRISLAAPVRVLPGGEPVKNDFRLIEQLMREMLELRIDRHSYVIVVGGGAVLDAAGLAAALVHRGLRLVRIPTTALAQNDAGVGVKNGVNFFGGKNAIGSFAPPFAVLNDFQFLLSLSERDWLNGVAEAFKVSIIRDRPFFEELTASADLYPARDFSAMQTLVRRCAELHLEHIRTNGDPFEYGQARPLDFGHWSAHKLELLSGFRISHGEAVASGVLLDSIYAHLQGWLKPAELAAIQSGLIRSGFQLWFPEYETRDEHGERAVFAGLREFQEHLGGELCVTFPLGIGQRFEVHEIDLAKMEIALQVLKGVVSTTSHDRSTSATTSSHLLPQYSPR